ncbi:hypothetical protein BDZ97DRAFT_15959 [Flammula alnicola]|nr:hypothetical protein BDZ97DRAFT_15959 [Flammula alnicola]
MSVVDIRVDLPSYSRTFTVKVQPSSLISQVKQEIYRTCPGQPRPDGQRLIWRGRVLTDNENIDDLWKADPRIVHLAVHPSAWSSLPPDIPQSPQPQAQATPISFSSYVPPSSYSFVSRPNPTTMRTEFTNLHRPVTPRSALNFVFYKHQKALHSLSPAIPPPLELGDLQQHRSNAVQVLERSGWSWPALLDEEFPSPSEGGLVYDVAVVEYVLIIRCQTMLLTFTACSGQPYLQLSTASDGEIPTPLQEHALRVLSYTFSILSTSLAPTPTVRAAQPQSMPVPPHVNQLLQQLGLPPLRAAGNNANPVANQNNPLLAEIREIPIRPLLAPLIMLVLRTLLLLYFVAPARKPIFGILILGWMLYEIWQPIRNGLRNGWHRVHENGQQQGNNNVRDARQGPNAGQPNVPQAPGAARPAPNVPIRPGAVGPVTLDLQAAQLFDTLANVNIEDEERMLHQGSGAPPAEPSFGHKIATFLGLFITTLHPAIWNRRRVALRRREGIVRTEAHVRNAPPPSPDGESDSTPTPADSEAARRREELRAQYDRRPRWIQRYMERVVAEDWVDDSD